MNGLIGTWTLLRLALRRDRIQLPVWLLAQAAILGGSGSSIVDLYNTVEEQNSYARTTATSAVSLAFNGPTSGPSLGAIVTVETTATSMLLVSLLTTFMVVRHTRQNEETGRAEMLGAGVVGRYAMLAAALGMAAIADVLFGGISALILLAIGLPATGALLYGAGLALVGLVFAGVAAVAAQVAESARAANGLAAAVVGVSFLLRAFGDSTGTVTRGGQYVDSSWPSYLSPIGWAQQVRPFADDQTALLLPGVLLFAALVVTAGVLTAHRDVGTGMLPVRPGPARASRALGSPLGLTWRLQRPSFIGWAVGIAVLGLAFGAVAAEVDDLVGGNEDLAKVLEQLGGSANLVDGYLSAIAGILALVSTGYVIQSLLRMRSEESGGTLEPVLATAVARTRWVGAHVVCTLVGLVVLGLIAGGAMGIAYGVTSGDVPGEFARGLGAALVRVPAVLVMGAAVVLLFGFLPRLVVAVSWALLGLTFVILQLGAILDLPQALLDLSPFTHAPAAPAAPVSALPLVALTLVAAALGGLGVLAFQRRDLAM